MAVAAYRVATSAIATDSKRLLAHALLSPSIREIQTSLSGEDRSGPLFHRRLLSRRGLFAGAHTAKPQMTLRPWRPTGPETDLSLRLRCEIQQTLWAWKSLARTARERGRRGLADEHTGLPRPTGHRLKIFGGA